MRVIFLSLCLLLLNSCQTTSSLEPVKIDSKGNGFELANSKTPFLIKGVNYDRDYKHRLIEDYWHEEWDTIVEDFSEMKNMGINAVRIHLQFEKFVPKPKTLNGKEIDRLKDLLKMAEEKGIYLNLTGLGCYHKNKVPDWYDSMSESERWEQQAFFWKSIAATCRESNAVFCYDLMNEPIVPGGTKVADSWLAGELAGKSYVQRLTRKPAGRNSKVIAEEWVKKMTEAIRSVDQNHLITVGVIPWVQVFPKAKPLFYSPEVSKYLDFVSVHFYPEKGKIPETITALKAYDIGKPIVIEETFPLKCSIKEFTDFLTKTGNIHDGFFSFYWGQTVNDLEKSGDKNAFIMIPYMKFLESYSSSSQN